MNRRLILATLAAASMATLAGCAGPYTVRADVSTYGIWPADRKASTHRRPYLRKSAATLCLQG